MSDGGLLANPISITAVMKNVSAVLISPKKRPIVPRMGLLGE